MNVGCTSSILITPKRWKSEDHHYSATHIDMISPVRNKKRTDFIAIYILLLHNVGAKMLTATFYMLFRGVQFSAWVVFFIEKGSKDLHTKLTTDEPGPCTYGIMHYVLTRHHCSRDNGKYNVIRYGRGVAWKPSNITLYAHFSRLWSHCITRQHVVITLSHFSNWNHIVSLQQIVITLKSL